MAKLFKKVEVLVSRRFYHGGDGLEDHDLRFFRSKEEYDELAERHSWNEGPSFKAIFCHPPVLLKVWVEARKWGPFLSGDPLVPANVKIDISDISKVP